MVTVSDEVKISCLMSLLRLAGNAAPVESVGVGLSEKLIFDIHNLTNREMSYLAQSYSNDILELSINFDRLEFLVGKVKQFCAEDNQALEFLRLGASTPLMVHLFGMQNSEVTAYRKALGIESNLGGRPKCSLEERLDVIHCWQQNAQIEEKQRYLITAKKLNLPLRVIHMVVMQEQTNPIDTGLNKAVSA